MCRPITCMLIYRIFSDPSSFVEMTNFRRFPVTLPSDQLSILSLSETMLKHNHFKSYGLSGTECFVWITAIVIAVAWQVTPDYQNSHLDQNRPF